MTVNDIVRSDVALVRNPAIEDSKGVGRFTLSDIEEWTVSARVAGYEDDDCPWFKYGNGQTEMMYFGGKGANITPGRREMIPIDAAMRNVIFWTVVAALLGLFIGGLLF